MEPYEFQWSEAHTFFSIHDRSVLTYGPYAFGQPQRVDYVVFGNPQTVAAYASSAMLSEWQAMSSTWLQPGVQERILSESASACQDLAELSNAFKEQPLSDASNAFLWETLDGMCRHIRRIGTIFSATQEAGTHALVKKAKAGLKGTAFDSEKSFSELTSPTQPDIVDDELSDIISLAKQVASDAQLEAHAQKHAWMFYQTFARGKVLESLHARVRQEQDTQTLQTQLDQIQAHRNELKEKQANAFAQLDSQTVDVLKLLQRLGHERLALKNAWAGAEWRFQSLYAEIARRTTTPLNDLLYAYTLDDFRSALLENKIPDATVIRERKQGYAVWRRDGQTQLLTGESADALRNKMGLDAVLTVSEVSGFVANPGMARGKAYVLHVAGMEQLIKDESAFQDGDVLITTMTQPGHAALVQRAAAVVADEGGVSSHASVIAREFGKPCIVGAKMATRVFKTGDLVEVDAEKGIIRRIE
ncbi:hypothetical protein HY572_05345 [Candidatus Micrarchaeota archaeon]|nr:hypothetical protein [Candidatus Micrarchaeota archaeon]